MLYKLIYFYYTLLHALFAAFALDSVGKKVLVFNSFISGTLGVTSLPDEINTENFVIWWIFLQ